MLKKEKEKIGTQILTLKMLKIMGFEVIKSNSEQIVVNTKENEMPWVMGNDVNYLTPTPCQWYEIDKEIKRLKETNNGRNKFKN